MEHQYFTVAESSIDLVYPHADNEDGTGSLAIFAQDAPSRDADGRVRGMKFSAPVLLVTDWFSPKQEIAAEVAALLNTHAAEFFPSALTREQRQAAHDRRVLAGEI